MSRLRGSSNLLRRWLAGNFPRLALQKGRGIGTQTELGLIVGNRVVMMEISNVTRLSFRNNRIAIRNLNGGARAIPLIIS
ncbi:unnamed protein product [Alternaria alternata]